MTNDLLLGVTLGVLIGYVEALNLNILLAGAKTWRDSLDNTLKATGQVLALPGFVFGGPWLSAQTLSWLTPENFASPYAIAFVVVFILGTNTAWTDIAASAGQAWRQPRRRRA